MGLASNVVSFNIFFLFVAKQITLLHICFTQLGKHFPQMVKVVAIFVNNFQNVFRQSYLYRKGRQNDFTRLHQFCIFHIFLSRNVRFPHMPLFDFVVVLCISGVHKHKKQQAFIVPPCKNNRTATTFKSQQIFHTWFLYFTVARSSAIFSEVSFTLIPWTIGTDSSLLTLCNSTAFRLAFEKSIEVLHSMESH